MAKESDDQFENKSSNPIWQLYKKYGSDNTAHAILGIISTLSGRMFGLVPAFIIGLAVDAIFLSQRPFDIPGIPATWIPSEPTGQLWIAVGILVGATVLGAISSWFEDWGWGVFAQRIQHNLRVDTYTHLQQLDMRYFTGQRTGELISILNNDVNALETFLEDGLSSIFWVSATFVGIGMILITLNPTLALITLLPVPFLVGFTFVFTRVIEPRYLKIRGEIGDLNAQLENNVSGIEVIKTEHAEQFEEDRVARASKNYLTANLNALRVQITYYPGLSIIAGIGFALTFLVGGIWLLQGPPLGLTGTLTPGAFVTFVIYAQQYIWPIIQFGSVIDDYERAKAAGTRVYGLLERSRDEAMSEFQEDFDKISGDVTYEDIWFQYDDLPILTGVSFDISAGETVGVVGPTGAGKSTLLKLLPRLYEPTSGEIRIDGEKIRNRSVESLRRNIGYVSQEPFLFYGTVKENIKYGTFDATSSNIIIAAKQAQAHEFITNLPDGYDTIVGERGVKLSGGQRQRLVIARTFLKDPQILILDEATSHVDTETEALIQRSLADFAKERTTFMIAHRLSTIRNADRILVLDTGEIVERGTHDELLEQNGVYANLWRVQAGDFDDLPREFLERAVQRQAELTKKEDGN